MLDALARRLALPVNTKAEVVRPSQQDGRCPSVSIVIPCFNYGHYLTQCTNSVLNQHGVRVDVLIIDDASSDGSDQIVRQFGTQDSRIRTICHAENQGLIATLNEALTQVTGDYSLILSADDLLTPGSLARATSLMEAYPSVGLTYGHAIEFTDDDLPAVRTVAKSWVIWPGYDWLMRACKTGENSVGSPGILIRTSILRSIDAYQTTTLLHAADFELWMQIAAVSDIGFIAGADQAFYRVHKSNMHYSFSVLYDFADRLRAFDAALSKRSKRVTDPDSMRDTAHRNIARMTLNQAIRDTAYRAIARSKFSRVIEAFEGAPVSDETVNEFAEFALKAWPDAARLREWRILNKLTGPDKPAGLTPLLMARMAIRKLRTRFRLWRRRRVGA
jgi:glycosyltransferase involved in cell wall biosynthesis